MKSLETYAAAHTAERVTRRPIKTIAEYGEAFVAGESVAVAGLCGRILRGKQPADFATLTNDPGRKIVLITGPEGLARLPGQTGYGMLHTIGYTQQHVAQLVRAEMQFKLAVFPEGDAARPATWPNMLQMVGQVYPVLREPLADHAAELQQTPFAEIERQAGYHFGDIETADDPRFMTYPRVRETDLGLVAVRAFLHDTVHLRELFSGDGYTYNEHGERGLDEHAVYNLPLADFPEHALLDLPPVEMNNVAEVMP